MAKEAVKQGLRPVLAGRSAAAVSDLAKELGLEARVFDLKTNDYIVRNLEGVGIVLHCAGPFSSTSEPMLQACLKSKTHYLDITGEIKVFEKIFSQNHALVTRGIAAIPGVGFDIVPTDCLAAKLKENLPNATHLSLALKLFGKMSPGTMKSVLEGIGVSGWIRKDSKLTPVPVASKTKQVCFRDKPEWVTSLPLADVLTAYYSTAIPNIEAYLAVSSTQRLLVKILSRGAVFFQNSFIQALFKKGIDAWVQGPVAAELSKGKVFIWGEVRNSSGQKVEIKMQIPDGYAFTASAALAAVKLALAQPLAPGAWTPSQAFGADFVFGLKGVRLTH